LAPPRSLPARNPTPLCRRTSPKGKLGDSAHHQHSEKRREHGGGGTADHDARCRQGERRSGRYRNQERAEAQRRRHRGGQPRQREARRRRGLEQRAGGERADCAGHRLRKGVAKAEVSSRF
jgi:hypothetical protein